MTFFVLTVIASLCVANAQEAPDSVSNGTAPVLPCSIQCSTNFIEAWALELNKEVGTFISSQHRHTIDNLASIVDAVKKSGGNKGSIEILDNLCMFQSTHEECVNGCDDEMKDFMLRGLMPLKFLCQERLQAYKDNVDCLATEDAKIRAICIHSSNELKLVQKFLPDLPSFPLEFRRNLTEQYCDLTVEHLNCTITEIDSSCGHNASSVMIDILEKSLEHTDKDVDHQKMKFPLPSQCTRLMKYADELRTMVTEPHPAKLELDQKESDLVASEEEKISRTFIAQEAVSTNETSVQGAQGSQVGEADQPGAGNRTSVMWLLVGVASVMVVLNMM